MALGPMTSLFGRTNRRISSQCAREEVLSFHIPQERLAAARFDGMTIVILDQAGYELPVFIPPNYICLLYTSPSPRDRTRSRMPSSA